VRERPEGVRGSASKAWLRRERDVVAAHGKAVAVAWRGGGVAGPRGAGVHARAGVLACQGRAVAMPCAGH
jgi:hypothetical protein